MDKKEEEELNWEDYDEYEEDNDAEEKSKKDSLNMSSNYNEDIFQDSFVPKNSGVNTSFRSERETYHKRPYYNDDYLTSFRGDSHVNKGSFRYKKNSRPTGFYRHNTGRYNKPVNLGGYIPNYKKKKYKNDYYDFPSNYKYRGYDIQKREYEVNDNKNEFNSKEETFNDKDEGIKKEEEANQEIEVNENININDEINKSNQRFNETYNNEKYKNRYGSFKNGRRGRNNYINKNDYFVDKKHKKENEINYNTREFKDNDGRKKFSNSVREISYNKSCEEFNIEKPTFYNSKLQIENNQNKKIISNTPQIAIPPIIKPQFLYIQDFLIIETLEMNIKTIRDNIFKLLKSEMDIKTTNLEQEYGSLNIKAQVYEPKNRRIKEDPNKIIFGMTNLPDGIQYNINNQY